MAKKAARRAKRQEQRSTNWTVIGGIILVGVLGLFGLLALSLRQPDIVTVEQRCAETPEACISVGSADAPVTLIEIFDFGCPHCRTYNDETEPLIEANYIENGDVQYVIFPYALQTATLPASNAAMCANDQGQYFEFKDALFNQFDEANYLTRDSFMNAASSVDMDMDAFAACVDEQRHADTIQENIQIARDQRITSTPNFLVNGTRLEGAQPFSVFEQRIESFIN